MDKKKPKRFDPLNPVPPAVPMPPKMGAANWFISANTFAFPFNFVDGHVVMSDGDRQVLVDTGAPTSIGNIAEWKFLGESIPLARSFSGVTPDQLTDFVGTRIDILLGADLLSRRAFQINLNQEQVVFPLILQSSKGCVLNARMVHGVPIVDVSAGNVKLQAVVDTGAKLSYLAEDLIKDLPQHGEAEDFYPGIGRFRTRTYSICWKLGTETVKLQCGVLPLSIRSLLGSFGVRGIIGTELLRHFVLGFSLQEGTIILQQIEQPKQPASAVKSQ